YSVVVMSSAASDAYPESAGVFTGKMVYTVYVRVGLAKGWILQYGLPQGAPAAAGQQRAKAELEAPWPYLLLRPELTRAGETGPILVSGVVNASGRFEQLAMVQPEDLAERDFLLEALYQWEFRPAAWGGEPTTVEVLLVIPEVRDNAGPGTPR